MTNKRLKTLNLCDRSVELLKTKHEGQSSFARRAILQHDFLLEQRDAGVMQEARDADLIALFADLVREVYLYPDKATERIEKVLQIDDEMRDWYRKDELAGKGMSWIRNRGRAVSAGVRL